MITRVDDQVMTVPVTRGAFGCPVLLHTGHLQTSACAVIYPIRNHGFWVVLVELESNYRCGLDETKRKEKYLPVITFPQLRKNLTLRILCDI